MAINSSVKIFDSVAVNYDKVRASYNSKMYDFINSVKPFNKDSNILELGAGTGIATKQILSYWPANVTAIEPGNELMAILEKNTESFNNLNLSNLTFEQFDGKAEFYDAIMAGTSFNWVDNSVKYEKCASLLKKDGILCLFWNYYRLKDVKLRAKQQTLYEENGLGGYRTNLVEFQETKMSERRREILNSGLFNLDHSELFMDSKVYSAEDYAALLLTYSDFYSIPNKESYMEEIKNSVEKQGGQVEVQICTQLEVAHKI